MFDLPGIVYLDPEKTGSTFVRRFLAATVKDAPADALDAQRPFKHRPTGKAKRKNALYFVSTRHPVDQYLSLYRFGRQGRGAFYLSLKRSGLSSLYAPGKLNQWLEFVLSAQARQYFDPLLKCLPPELPIGPAALRLIKANTPHPEDILLAGTTLTSVESQYAAHALADMTIRLEHLQEDMRTLITERARHCFVPDSALKMLASSRAANTTEQLYGQTEDVDAELRERILHLDSLVIRQGSYG
ncbi:MAG: hypothetical protein O3C15_00180 [Proteobacteria bacterium]|nr:hypothetical protein [Pseudomonadota bacterium]